MSNVFKVILLTIMLSPVVALAVVVIAHSNWLDLLLGVVIGMLVALLLEKS